MPQDCNDRIELLGLEIGYYLTRLENHPDDGPERIGHCLGLMKLLGGEARARELQSQITAIIENGADGPTTPTDL